MRQITLSKKVSILNKPEGCLKELFSIFLLHSVYLFRVTLLQKKVTRDEYNLKAVSLSQMDARPVNELIASVHSLKIGQNGDKSYSVTSIFFESISGIEGPKLVGPMTREIREI